MLLRYLTISTLPALSLALGALGTLPTDVSVETGHGHSIVVLIDPINDDNDAPPNSTDRMLGASEANDDITDKTYSSPHGQNLDDNVVVAEFNDQVAWYSYGSKYAIKSNPLACDASKATCPSNSRMAQEIDYCPCTKIGQAYNENFHHCACLEDPIRSGLNGKATALTASAGGHRGNPVSSRRVYRTATMMGSLVIAPKNNRRVRGERRSAPKGQVIRQKSRPTFARKLGKDTFKQVDLQLL
ncbi:hypothetical protein AK830_g2074 [Neonectria ditissima]|uniref:Uncharacterized protein n=1 Tax=Neonectria ditissima TaxID=78410 RepID=A0A0P7BVN0_9HYPO|nr:hypothetical protein AK830_g2074 [Neonectria ditissima]